jgi:sodium pump decarboxylase gamma subunit
MGVTVNKSSAEKLENAGLNTLLGMGMAFAVLIIISLIISLFPIFIGGNKRKKVNDKELAKEAMDNTISQIEEKEDLVGDAELVAVIAAAIAAYEGSASTDGFQVRSIRKVNKNWKR